jgi:uncharacterized protein YpuA (DUF1002 family)
MTKKLIVEIAEGFGNQLFMYAHAFALAKEIEYDLLIDNTSGYSKIKNKMRNHQKYMLDFMKISKDIAPSKYKYDNFFKRKKKKIELIFDKFN